MPRRYQEIQSALRNDPTSFPEIRAVAEMRPLSQTIHLHQASQEDFKEIQEWRANVGKLQFHAETYLHEVMHWYDLVSTLWGTRFLDLIYLCHDIHRSHHNAEDKFHKLVELYDEERRIMCPRYYHVVRNERRKHSPQSPWRIQFTAGLEFDAYGHQNPERPIFFVRFSDHNSNELVARQPLTVGALLETKAIASEYHTAIEMMARTSDSKADFRTQLSIYSRHASAVLYDRDLTIYTAPAHLLSYFVGTKEAMLTYDYAAALANVALNMTDAHLNALSCPDEFVDFGDQRLDAFRRSRDRGYAFSALAVHADRYNPEVSLAQWLDAALKRAGLPSYAQFSEQVRNAVTERTPLTLEDDGLLYARQELDTAGRFFFNAMTAEGTHWITLSHAFQQELPMPYAFDSEGNLFSLGNALKTSAFHPELLYNQECELIKFRDNFLIGARGVRIAGP